MTPVALELGNHRVLCGDSGDPQIIEQLYGDVEVGCLLTQSAAGLHPPEGLEYVPVQLYGGSDGSCWIFVNGYWDRRPLGYFGPRHDGSFANQAIQYVTGALLEFALPGCIVADPFLGTGTTLLACEDTGHACYGIDISPGRCEQAAYRWEQHRAAKEPA